MSQTFADAALHLCALAARSLAWRPHEFWAATPAELAACLADPAQGGPIGTPLGRGELERMMQNDCGGGPDGHG